MDIDLLTPVGKIIIERMKKGRVSSLTEPGCINWQTRCLSLARRNILDHFDGLAFLHYRGVWWSGILKLCGDTVSFAHCAGLSTYGGGTPKPRMDVWTFSHLVTRHLKGCTPRKD